MRFSIFSNKGERDIKIPDTWETLPTSAYIQLAKEWDGKDMVKAFSCLTGIPFQTMFDKKDPELEAQLMLATSFLFSQPQDFKSAKVPEYFEFDDWKIKTKDLSLSIGQSIQVRQKLDTCKSYDEAIAFAIATVIQPKIDGEVNSERAEQLEGQILEMPITKTYTVGFFFAKAIAESWKDYYSKMATFEDNAPLNEKRQNVAALAKVERLEPFRYLDMIGDYAERFGLDPDFVYKNSKFETVTAFLISWKEKREFEDRYLEWDKMLNQQTPK